MSTRLPVRPMPQAHTLFQLYSRNLFQNRSVQPARHASSKPITSKSRILERPDRFRPPSHGKRLPRPRRTFGPALSDTEVAAQKSKRYPNMMPPRGSFMYWILTNRALHLWISLGTLTSLAVYTLIASFASKTHFRDQLPYSADFLWHPIQAIRQSILVFKLHTEYESQKVAQRRKEKIEDAAKRKEFLRAHGVEPGFLTGTWMERFGTVEGDRARELAAKAKEEAEIEAMRKEGDGQSPIAVQNEEGDHVAQSSKPKRWLGIW